MNEQIHEAMWGLIVGDAAGVPYEFHAPSEIPPGVPFENLDPPPGYRVAHAHAAPCAWSDDGAHALAVADALVTSDPNLPSTWIDRFVENMIAWREQGAFTPDGVVFDCGIQTAHALEAWSSRRVTAQNFQTVTAPVTSNGNGSLMRALPLALLHRGEARELYAVAGVLSSITHPHPVSKMACGFYSLIVRHLLDGSDPQMVENRTWDDLTDILGREQAARIMRSLPKEPTGTGFVLDSLAFALHALAEGTSYEETIRRAIQLGSDTDTTAAIAGGVVALAHGGVPSKWIRSVLDPANLVPHTIERMSRARGTEARR